MNRCIIYFHRLHFSGSSQTIQVLRDYHSLLSYGHDVHLFYRAPQPLPEAELSDWVIRHGLKPVAAFQFHCIAEGFGGKRRLRDAAHRLAIASKRPVVFVVRTMDHARAALSLRSKIGADKVTVLIELHEGAFPHRVYQEQGRGLRAWFSRQLERRILARVDGIIATVGSQLPLLEQSFPRHARTIVLPNGVDLAAFAATRAAAKPTDGLFHLRYAGQFLAWKNTDVMIEALKSLPDHVILDLAGGKPGAEAQARAAIETTARRYGVERRVRYAGFLSPAEVPAFLMQADALLLPLGNNVQSRYFTSPMKLFEYAASGVPMIVARQPTTQSLVQEQEQALMYTADSARELAHAVSELMQSPVLAARLAVRAQEWVRQYSYDERARRYQLFLEGTLNK